MSVTDYAVKDDPWYIQGSSISMPVTEYTVKDVQRASFWSSFDCLIWIAFLISVAGIECDIFRISAEWNVTDASGTDLFLIIFWWPDLDSFLSIRRRYRMWYLSDIRRVKCHGCIRNGPLSNHLLRSEKIDVLLAKMRISQKVIFQFQKTQRQ